MVVYCGIGMLEIGVEDSGVEPWGKLVDGGLDWCERGSIAAARKVFFFLWRIGECEYASIEYRAETR